MTRAESHSSWRLLYTLIEQYLYMLMLRIPILKTLCEMNVWRLNPLLLYNIPTRNDSS